VKERMRSEHHESAQLQDYGWLKNQMIEIVTALRNLEMNVVMTCHLKEREVAGISSFLPAIEGGFAGQVAGYVDISVVLRSRLTTQIVGEDTVRVVERYMQAVRDPQHTFIKDHSNKLPQEFPLNFEDDYERLATLIYGAPPEIEPLPEDDDEDEDEAVTNSVTADSEGEVAGDEAQQSLLTQNAGEPRFHCSNCGDGFDDEDQHDLGRIRFNQVLCKPCFKGRS
jgi:hypothetical protein